MPDIFSRSVEIEGAIDAAQYEELIGVADRCPVHQTLEKDRASSRQRQAGGASRRLEHSQLQRSAPSVGRDSAGIRSMPDRRLRSPGDF